MSDWKKVGEGKYEAWNEKPEEPMGCLAMIGAAVVWIAKL